MILKGMYTNQRKAAEKLGIKHTTFRQRIMNKITDERYAIHTSQCDSHIIEIFEESKGKEVNPMDSLMKLLDQFMENKKKNQISIDIILERHPELKKYYNGK